MNRITGHPDVVSYARGMQLSQKDAAAINTHLQECGECRDLVLFARKTSAMLVQEGRIDRVAKALGKAFSSAPGIIVGISWQPLSLRK